MHKIKMIEYGLISLVSIAAVVYAAKLDVTEYTHEDDRVIVLDANNFENEVYNSKTTMYMQFFAAWCHVCKRYAQTWKNLAKDTQEWKSVIRVGVLDCSLVINDRICVENKVMGYPTFQQFPAMTVLKPGDQRRFILDEEEIMREMIYVVETHQNPPSHWPIMRAYEGTLEDLRLNYPNNKHFLCIFENDDSYIARKLILDFSSHLNKLAIVRITPDTNADLFQQLDISELPSFFLVSLKHSGGLLFRNFEDVVVNMDKTVSHGSVKMNFDTLEREDLRYKIAKKIATFMKFYDFYNDPFYYN